VAHPLEQTQREKKKQGSHIQEDKSGGKIEAGFLQVFGPNQQCLSTEGGNFTEVKIHLRPYRLNL